MKSLNAKRIAAIAASLVLGMAVAGPVSFGSIPIINSAGQPVVQIVVGSTAQPSDGVVAANIAAVIGNLAHSTSSITATVGNTSGLSCVTTASACTVSNASVYLGEKGVVTATGSYNLKALIGSVLNGAVLNYNNLQYTKSLSTASQYTYPHFISDSQYPITSTPSMTSAFAGVSLTAHNAPSSTTGGGVNGFSQFTDSGNDNIVAFSSSQVPGLLNNAGSTGETEYLWFGGFPVFDQATGVNNFQVLSPVSAYQVVFNTPPKVYNSGNINHAAINLLGSSWTVFNATLPSVSAPTSNQFVVGGKLQLAAASTPLSTIYVGHNLTSGPLTVVLQDLSYTNSSGGSKAAVAVENNGKVTNETSIAPGQTVEINSSGTITYVYVQNTFAGLYSVQRWAKLQLFSSVTNVTSGSVFNNNPNWYASLRWTTNQSASPNGNFASGTASANDAELEGIVLYSNMTSSSSINDALAPGATYNLPGPWKITFVGDTLGTPGSGNNNYDSLSLSTTAQTSPITYSNGAVTSNVFQPNGYTYNTLGAQNIGATTLASNEINLTTVTEPAQLLTVSSGLSTAFQVQNTGSLPNPTSASSVQYNLDSYSFAAYNAVMPNGITTLQSLPNYGIAVTLTALGSEHLQGNYITPNNQQTIEVQGHQEGQTGLTSIPVTFNGFNQLQTYTGYAFTNVTNILLPNDYPAPGISVSVYDVANTAVPTYSSLGSNAVLMGTLTYAGPTVLYKTSQYNYYLAPNALTANVIYTEESASNVNFALSQQSVTSNTAVGTYFTYNMPLITQTQSTTANANVIVGITNSTGLLEGQPYWLNNTSGVSGGNNNAVVYQSSFGQNVKALAGFRDERGGEVASISTQSVVYDMPISVDTLQFLVGPSASNVTTKTQTYGPYSVGQATNIANVTIANVAGHCNFVQSTAGCTVTGTGSLTATPSVNSAITPVSLNTAQTPLAVLDSQASGTSTLVLVGSKFVNSVSGQVFEQNPSLNSTFAPGSVVVQAFGTNRILVAGYSANETVQAGNQFIQDLLTNAASGTA